VRNRVGEGGQKLEQSGEDDWYLYPSETRVPTVLAQLAVVFPQCRFEPPPLAFSVSVGMGIVLLKAVSRQASVSNPNLSWVFYLFSFLTDCGLPFARTQSISPSQTVYSSGISPSTQFL